MPTRIELMEELIKHLRRTFLFKDTTAAGDVVLIVAGVDGAMLYALVTDIVRDETRRDEWWNLSLQILSFPPQKAVWTLRTPQFTGMEVFTMGGEERFVKALDFGEPDPRPHGVPITSGTKPGLRVVK